MKLRYWLLIIVAAGLLSLLVMAELCIALESKTGWRVGDVLLLAQI